MHLVLYIIGLFVLLEILNYLYFYLFYNIKFLRQTLFLGVFIHEFSHFLMCKLTGAPVFDFKVGLKSGFVKHGHSKIPFLGNILISLAPLFVGIALLIGIMIILSSLTYSEFWQMAQTSITLNLDVLVTHIKIILSSFNYSHWTFWILLLLSLSILATFKPSHQDLGNAAYVLALLVFLSYYAFMVPINLMIIFVLVLANFLQLIAIVLVLPIYLIKKFILKR